jgi:hypothetical protein
MGLAGGINPYVYAKDRPDMLADPSGLFSFTMGFSWSMVDSLPRRRGEWPGGRTTYSAHTRCDCICTGGLWKLSGCSAGAVVQVDLLTGVSDPAEARFYRDSEAQHVADFRAGSASVRQAGEAAEQLARDAPPFGSKFSCESYALDVVSSAVYAALKGIKVASQARYDDSGLHHWNGAPWRIANPYYWF